MVKYGPMQLLVIGFPGNEFSGEIVPEPFEPLGVRHGHLRVMNYGALILYCLRTP
jgi:hypothetical protein